MHCFKSVGWDKGTLLRSKSLRLTRHDPRQTTGVCEIHQPKNDMLHSMFKDFEANQMLISTNDIGSMFSGQMQPIKNAANGLCGFDMLKRRNSWTAPVLYQSVLKKATGPVRFALTRGGFVV